MTPKIRSVGRGPAGRRYLSSDRELRLGVYFWFRLFNVAPETTARFSYLDDQSRSQSPPCLGSDRFGRSRHSTARGGPPRRGGNDGLLAGPATDLLAGPSRLLLGVAGTQDIALVVEAATLGQRQLHLRPPVPEVQRDRDQGQRLLLGLAEQL